MITLFIAIGGIVVQCLGARWCELFPPVMFHHYWEAGLVELMFEVPILGSLVLKIYRMKKDKITKDREIDGDK